MSPEVEEWMRHWSDREIQVLVLLSLTLQIILLVFAGFRRRVTSAVLKILLWLAFLGANFTTTYALGELSTNRCKKGRPLFAFWAPFLLLHLGGQNSITAYSLEDNKLWLRRLLTMGAQAATAVYIIYDNKITGGHGRLLIAAMLVFLAGILKYGERIWALKCASLDSFRSSLQNSDVTQFERATPRPQVTPAMFDLEEYDDAEGINGGAGSCGAKLAARKQREDAMLEAQSLFHIYKRLFADVMVEPCFWQHRSLRGAKAERAYMVIEMELSLMYDILYTKAAVIHTWGGYCIRVVSLLSTTAALLLFMAESKQEYRRENIIITYVLLIGACALELNSILAALVSSWTCSFLQARQWHLLLRAVLLLLRFNYAENSRGWSNSMGQYNLMSFYFRDKIGLRRRIARLIGFEDRWVKSYHTRYIVVSRDMKRYILRELQVKAVALTEAGVAPADFRNCRGEGVLQHLGFSEQLAWSVKDINFAESILAWHIATDMFLLSHKVANARTRGPCSETVRELSNYMLYLLVVHPHMLPGPVMHIHYGETCKELAELSVPTRRLESNPDDCLMTIEQERPNRSALKRAVRLYKLLRNILLQHMNSDIPQMLGVIAAVWVEMLCYAANNCDADVHAAQLSSGGELATFVWFLMAHLGIEGHLLERPPRQASDADALDRLSNAEARELVRLATNHFNQKRGVVRFSWFC